MTGTKMSKNVGEKYQDWLVLDGPKDMEQAFCAGHCSGAEHRHNEVHVLRDALEHIARFSTTNAGNSVSSKVRKIALKALGEE